MRYPLCQERRIPPFSLDPVIRQPPIMPASVALGLIRTEARRYRLPS